MKCLSTTDTKESAKGITYADSLLENSSNASMSSDKPTSQDDRLGRKRTTSTSAHDLSDRKATRPKSCNTLHDFALSSSHCCKTYQLRKDFAPLPLKGHDQVFIGNIPTHATDQIIRDTLSRFGQIYGLSISRRPSNGTNYGFVQFTNSNSVSDAVLAGEVQLLNYPEKIRLELKRKTNPKISPQADKLNSRDKNSKSSCIRQTLEPRSMRNVPTTTPPRLAQSKLDLQQKSLLKTTGSISPLKSVNHGIFYDTLKSFNWRKSAARYVYRIVTMEDYLLRYIFAQASYRQIEFEGIVSLTDRLVTFSNSRPEDVVEMMPPSISGLVYNQTLSCANGRKFFDACEIIQNSSVLKIHENIVCYNHSVPTNEAAGMLKELLVEGLFIYFFAKFCHGPKFKIKYSFYQRSEPIKSTLFEVTGNTSIPLALISYFDMFNEIFCFEEKTCELTLKVDYFDKSVKEKLRRFLPSNSNILEENDFWHQTYNIIKSKSTKNSLSNVEMKNKIVTADPQEDSPCICNEHESCKISLTFGDNPTISAEVEHMSKYKGKEMSKNEVILPILTESDKQLEQDKNHFDHDYSHAIDEANDYNPIELYVNPPRKENDKLNYEGYGYLCDRKIDRVHNNPHDYGISQVSTNDSCKLKFLGGVMPQSQENISKLLEPIEVLHNMTVDPYKLEQSLEKCRHPDRKSISYEDYALHEDNPVLSKENIKDMPYLQIGSFPSSNDTLKLPDAVSSVVYGALREDDGHNILSNPWAIDVLLNKLEDDIKEKCTLDGNSQNIEQKSLFSREKRDQLKIQIEEKIRKMVSKFVTENQ